MLNARVAELVYAHDLKSCLSRDVGSTPTSGTIYRHKCDMIDLQEKTKEIKEFVISNKRKVIISLVVFFVILTILCITLNKSEESETINFGPFGGFAQCLTDNNVKVYGTSWCATCNDQKALFGRSWGLVNSIECSEETSRARNATCITEKIEAYPTWEFADGSRQTIDNLTFDLLSEKSGCPLPLNMVNSN